MSEQLEATAKKLTTALIDLHLNLEEQRGDRYDMDDLSRIEIHGVFSQGLLAVANVPNEVIERLAEVVARFAETMRPTVPSPRTAQRPVLRVVS